ncbi:hypothetical protein DL93DRAFT_2082318 [Clavulina sp. PMI_390]|nr:hypothetical protein DL93DRAFT_2082318 [Clavulina sp. PMI_390]
MPFVASLLHSRPRVLAFILFAWVVVQHITGLSLFTRGFLLSRLALPNKSSCSPLSECTLPPTHKRAVILIIDALRFDFIAPEYALPEEQQSEHYHNVLTLPRELTERFPHNSFLFNAHSDPPTATLQRIKGLTTGSLPTFVDIGASFSAAAIEEDSLITQLKAAGKKIAFAGDDTWLTAFSNPFEKNMSWPYDSFNVEDLHSVDEGVIRHMFPLLEGTAEGPASSMEWDVFLGHFLGVDHVGHRLGPDHPTMRAKLTQMDTVLRQVVASLEDDTLLVVLGDHGMDPKGDHGGDGRLETSSAMWVYSKGVPLSSTQGEEDADVMKIKTFEAFPGAAATGIHRSIQQIDIVPTLSLLLGLPIPFNNLGSIIPELFTYEASSPPKGKSKSKSSPPTLARLERAIKLNAEQIMAYLNVYRTSSSGPELDVHWEGLTSSFATISSPSSSPILLANDFNRLALETCRALWARFNAPLMLLGLGLLLLAVLSTAAVYAGFSRNQQRISWEERTSAVVERASLGAAIGAAAAIGLLSVVDKSTRGWASEIGTSDAVWAAAAAGSQLSVLFSFIFGGVTRPKYASSLSRVTFTGTILPLVLLILHALSYFSNSFILWEDHLAPLFLQVLILTTLVTSALAAPTSTLRTRLISLSLITALLVRLASTSTICREEQQPYCSVTFYASSTRPLAPVPVLFAVLPLALALPSVVRRAFLTTSRSDEGPARFILEVLWRCALVGGSAYWVVEWVESVFGGNSDGGAAGQVLQATSGPNPRIGSTTWSAASLVGRTVLARVVLLASLVGGSVFVWNAPLNIDVSVTSTPSSTSPTGMKKTVTVLGFANTFGSAYLMHVLPVFATLWIATQLTGQVVLALGLGALLCWVEVMDGVRDARKMVLAFESASTAQEALDALDPASSTAAAKTAPSSSARAPTLLEPAFLALLAHTLFFSTGHQAVLSSIQWKTAFVGFPILTYPWSPALVSLNTFGSFLLCALAVPLFVAWDVAPIQPPPPPPANKTSPPTPAPRQTTALIPHALQLALSTQLYFSTILLGSATSAALLRRHLMVWKVFAPRFMLGGVVLLVVDAGLALGVWGGLLWGVVGKVERLFGRQV